MKLKSMTLAEIEAEANNFLCKNDEDAQIIPDGNIDAAAKLVAEFVHHLWEIDAVYEPEL